MNTPTESELVCETGIIAKLTQEERENEGWKVTLDIDDVPQEIGNYALYDGLVARGGGVTWNMRQSVLESSWFGKLKRPIYLWFPDSDGSVALWLDGKIRCSECALVFEIEKLAAHGRDAHGWKLEETEED
jgi:hypothetical protein